MILKIQKWASVWQIVLAFAVKKVYDRDQNVSRYDFATAMKSYNSRRSLLLLNLNSALIGTFDPIAKCLCRERKLLVLDVSGSGMKISIASIAPICVIS